MEFQYASGVYSFRVSQVLNISIDEAWAFFSSPKNLEAITPKDLSFKITSNDLGTIHNGQIVTYRIGLFPLIKTNWVSEIREVDDRKAFVDYQLKGPYKLWHHRHSFEAVEEGTLVTDVVHFKLPFGIIQKLAFKLIVKPKLTKIFNYRKTYLSEMFE